MAAEAIAGRKGDAGNDSLKSLARARTLKELHEYIEFLYNSYIDTMSIISVP